jgi:hypothetical protein
VFVHCKPFQSNLIKQEPTRVKNLSGAPPKSGLLAFTAKLRIGLKGQRGTNALTYFEHIIGNDIICKFCKLV